MTVKAEPEVAASNAPAPGVVVTTAVAAPVATDVEKQQPSLSGSTAYAAPSSTSAPVDYETGKGMGIAMFVVILVGLIFNWLVPIVSFICIITAIVLSSIITCSCCCASDYNLQPHVKKFSTATLVSLVLIFIIQIIYFIAVFAAASTEAANTGTVSSRTAEGASVGLIIVAVLSLILNFVALIFSALFTWGRSCCAPA